MTFQITKPGFYKQRGGGKAEVVGRDRLGMWVGCVDLKTFLWDDAGNSSSRNRSTDLVAEWPPERNQYRIWVNVYQFDYPEAYYSKETADRNWEGRIACKEITVTEGEGL